MEIAARAFIGIIRFLLLLVVITIWTVGYNSMLAYAEVEVDEPTPVLLPLLAEVAVNTGPGSNPETDSSPAPSPDPTQDPTQEPSVNPSPSPTISPIPTPTPTTPPPQSQCDFFQFKVKLAGGATGNRDIFTKVNDPNIPDLVTQRIEEEVETGRQFCRDLAASLIAQGKATKGKNIFNPKTGKAGAGFDRCVAETYFGAKEDAQFVQNPNFTSAYDFFFNDCANSNASLKKSQTSFNRDANGNFVLNGKATDACVVNVSGHINVTYFLDAQGNVIPASQVTKNDEVCLAATYQWAGSPISLIWTPGTDIDANISITRFAVDPSKVGNYFLWKASAQTPLLVYDPEHSGKVTSAHQLFGNWTFGGKRTASLHVNSVNQEAPEPQLWRDGYEALGSLDENGDNKVSDQELAPLGLWFDNNQDGISQPGEVVSLADAQVITLYYHPDRVEPATKNIIATQGFERLLDGEIIRGSSVDWHTANAASKEELIAPLQLGAGLGKNTAKSDVISSIESLGTKADNQSFESPVATNSNATSEEEIDKEIDKEIDLDPRKNLSGFWHWNTSGTTNRDGIPPLNGYLGFSDDNSGSISGHSYGITDLPYSSSELRSTFTIAAFYGKKIEDSGNFYLSFEFPADGAYNQKSEAKLVKAGSMLIGKTTATVFENGKPITISYNWEAYRD